MIMILNTNMIDNDNDRVIIIQQVSRWRAYTRSPLEDSRLFGPSPWKVLATTYEKKDY